MNKYKKITEEEKRKVLKSDIQDYIDNHPIEFRWDRMEVPDSMKYEILCGSKNKVIDTLVDDNMHYINTCTNEILKHASKKFGLSIDELMDMNIEMPIIDTKIEEAGKLNCRLEIMSNFDCMPSAWAFGNDRYYLTDSYLDDVLNLLNINPLAFKGYLEQMNLMVATQKIKSKRDIDFPELVSPKSLLEEIINTTCGCNLFTIPIKIDMKEIIKLGHNIKKIDVTGCYYGFYSSCQGGGSIFENKFTRKTVIDLENENRYPRWSIVPDSREYSMSGTYGSNSLFKDAKIIEAKKE